MKRTFSTIPGMLRAIRGLFADRRGATTVEYALIIAVIVLMMLVGFSQLASLTIGIWNDNDNKVANAR